MLSLRTASNQMLPKKRVAYRPFLDYSLNNVGDPFHNSNYWSKRLPWTTAKKPPAPSGDATIALKPAEAGF